MRRRSKKRERMKVKRQWARGGDCGAGRGGAEQKRNWRGF